MVVPTGQGPPSLSQPHRSQLARLYWLWQRQGSEVRGNESRHLHKDTLPRAFFTGKKGKAPFPVLSPGAGFQAQLERLEMVPSRGPR